ncbi:segregation/condensation protein A [Halorhabdus sp. CBA1104]|uniref:segregation/condensation protein A n=1 Tax=Halorhabdus sp. CBA1104 TaxID=1380432 RepID=UPI0012B3C09D|nr:segregation/condensation protein A [Halorhabdus sp. CBA1104]QGN06208.1 segregation/condensation protein A [Halorhabdus sp. CBA1104]
MTEDVPLDIAGHEGRERPDGGTEVLTDASPPTDGPSIDDEADVEPVEVLVTMAEEDEIEPWDIDVVVVTDKFLDRLDEADLRTSGRALFYASVLLRMKSDALLEDDDEPEPEPEPDPFVGAPGETVDGDPFDALEDEMDRRLDRKRARGTPQTLDELVRELREAERDTWWKDSREYDTSDSPRGFQRGTQQLDYRASDDFRDDSEPTAADVTGTAHGENVEELVESVAEKLESHYEAGREEVLFAEVEAVGGSRIETFLGVLFLADTGRVELQQDTLFGDLWLRNPDVTQQSDVAAADD